MRTVPLRNRHGEVIARAIVDDDDYERVMAQGKWSLNSGHVQNSRWVNGKSVTIQLHRFILELSPGDPSVDHEDRNPLNNQRSNLRFANEAQNQQNVSPSGNANNTSGHRGVTWNRRSRRWQVQMRLNGKRHYLGCFADLDEAAEVARDWRAAHMPFSPEAGG